MSLAPAETLLPREPGYDLQKHALRYSRAARWHSKIRVMLITEPAIPAPILREFAQLILDAADRQEQDR